MLHPLPVCGFDTVSIGGNSPSAVAAPGGMPVARAHPANRLLAALSLELQNRLSPHLELVSLPFGTVVHESGHAMRHIYFPADCIVSMLYVLSDGKSTEISLVGNEGLVGVPLYLGGESATSRAVVQSAGLAYRLPRSRLKEELNRQGELLLLTLRYTQSILAHTAQAVVCNRYHTVDQQLCRWLLLSLDRLPGSVLTMTQELMAAMLGVRREGVTESAGKLQKLGVIEYKRGRITVIDRRRLEALSCECYAVVKKETDRILPCSHPAVAHLKALSATATAEAA